MAPLLLTTAMLKLVSDEPTLLLGALNGVWFGFGDPE